MPTTMSLKLLNLSLNKKLTKNKNDFKQNAWPGITASNIAGAK